MPKMLELIVSRAESDPSRLVRRMALAAIYRFQDQGAAVTPFADRLRVLAESQDEWIARVAASIVSRLP